MSYDPQVFTVTVNAPGVEYSDDVVRDALKRVFCTGRYDGPDEIVVIEDVRVPTDDELDRLTYLVGGEDGDVGLFCRLCDHGGRPIASLTSVGEQPVWADNDDVTDVTTLSALVEAGRKHGYAHNP